MYIEIERDRYTYKASISDVKRIYKEYIHIYRERERIYKEYIGNLNENIYIYIRNLKGIYKISVENPYGLHKEYERNLEGVY